MDVLKRRCMIYNIIHLTSNCSTYARPCDISPHHSIETAGFLFLRQKKKPQLVKNALLGERKVNQLLF